MRALLGATRAYTLTLTDGQALVLRDACELLARVHMGQFGHVVDEVVLHRENWRDALKPAHEIADQLERVLFPRGLGIKSADIQDRSRVAWDLYQVVRGAIAWADVPPGAPRPSMQVQYDRPMHTGETEPLAKCEVQEGD